ncbi:MAG: hypothetical protein Q7K43_05250 [Candidatus Woesearchaeota archaeon]|nr:hypothetical protein [Candidatus Woesearchaeota archaeon]
MALQELIVKSIKKDNVTQEQVFTFDGSLGTQVWESTPVTRFRFSKPVENDYFKKQLAANHPTAGILFQGIPYVGTSDGFVYPAGSQNPQQRIPEILVDTEIFVQDYKFSDANERKAFEKFRQADSETNFASIDETVLNRLFKINRTLVDVIHQERILDCYLEGMIAIRGFVANKDPERETLTLYDAHPLGISDTCSGKIINDIEPHVLCQVTPELGGFVPAWNPNGVPINTIEAGIVKNKLARCVDYKSLWNLQGSRRLVQNICPRDGSGYAAAKFATNGVLSVVSHGNHPCYHFDIYRKENGMNEKVKSIELDLLRTPSKLFIREGEIFGLQGTVITNFSKREDLFIPKQGRITSIADSGLCTVQIDDKKTEVYNPFCSVVFSSKQIASLAGEYVFLSATPQ